MASQRSVRVTYRLIRVRCGLQGFAVRYWKKWPLLSTIAGGSDAYLFQDDWLLYRDPKVLVG